MTAYQEKNWSTPTYLFFSILVLFPCQSQYISSKIDFRNQQHEEEMLDKGPPTQPFPYALSSTYLTHLARTEMDIYKEMGKYAKAVEKRIALIRAYMKDYEESSLKETSKMPKNVDPVEKAAVITGNPIATFRLISRFAIEFSAIGQDSGQQLERKLGGRINELAGQFPFPAKADVRDAVEALLRVQYIYNLNIEQFARGEIMGVQTKVGFPASQTYRIGEYAANMDYFSLAMDWFKVTQSKMNESSDTTVSVNPLKLSKSINANIEKHDKNFERNKNHSHWYMFMERLSEKPDAVTLRSVSYEKLKGANQSVDFEAPHYRQMALCNGENFQTPKQMAGLKCWYNRKNPYFYLFPLKTELLNEEPLLIQYHDVISDQWSKELQRAAMPTLKRFDPRIQDGTARTAIYTYLEDEEVPVPFSRRVELISGLNVRGSNASQALQVASYAYGGHVSAHSDSIGEDGAHDPSYQLKGDRVAIFLAYLNDVENGGLTAFPTLGVHVKPIKGSAVFWYASLKNGQVDKRFLHAACPLVMGHKWIATKRVHLHKNFLTRPCDLNPNL